MTTIGFLGCGAMGGAIARALVERGAVEPGNLFLYDRYEARRREMAQQLGAVEAATEAEVAQKAELVVLACKPRDVSVALGAVEWPSANRTLVSVAAGVSSERLRDLVPASVAVARVMPNVAAMIGQGVTGVLRHYDTQIMAQVTQLFETCGEVVVLEREKDFAALSALSGAGPAYFFVALEALADGGVLMGLTREMSMKLAVHTMKGAAALAIATDEHPAVLKDRVASPGGITIMGLSKLEAGGFRSSLIEAVAAATGRDAVLGDNAGRKKG